MAKTAWDRKDRLRKGRLLCCCRTRLLKVPIVIMSKQLTALFSIKEQQCLFTIIAQSERNINPLIDKLCSLLSQWWLYFVKAFAYTVILQQQTTATELIKGQREQRANHKRIQNYA